MKKLHAKRILMTIAAIVLLNAEIAFAEGSWIPISGTMFVSDTFNGVDAVYTENYNSGSDTTYCCAAYVKKYYKAVYGVTVYNLIDNGPLKLMEGGNSLIKVDTPQSGDILFWTTSKNKSNHSAIVKKVEGNTITLIEQNYKSNKKAMINRTVTYPSDKFEIWRLSDTSNFKSASTTSESKTVSYITKDSALIKNASAISTVQNVRADGEPEFVESSASLSYYLESNEPIEFIISEDNIYCWYYNGVQYVRAEKNKKISTVAAYITFYDDRILSKDSIILVDENLLNSHVGFYDVNMNYWAYDSIQKCVALGIIKGNTDGTFRPEEYITREQFAVMAVRASKLSIIGYDESSFLDVNGYYMPYIEAAKQYMLTDYSQKYFNPSEYITREDVIAALVKMLGISTDNAKIIQFADSSSISAGMESYLSAAYDYGLVKGFSDNTIKPQLQIKRSEAASLFARAFANN